MSVLFDLRRLGWRLWAPAAAAVVVVACGGGTSQIKAFEPARLIVFGDESSVIVDDGAGNGRKYTVNSVDAQLVRDCLLLPNWVQGLAVAYSFVFAECNPAAATPKAFMRARAGARVGDATQGIGAQISAQAAAGGALTTGDLVSVMMGGNDIVELATQVQAGSLSADEALAEVRRRGTLLAEGVNDILATGARAVVATVPDLGLTPLALAMDSQSAGAKARLSSFTVEFNARLRTSLDSTRFDGRNYGLVLADDLVQAMSRLPAAYNLKNTANAVCSKALPDCTSAASDLVAGAIVSEYLWADDRRLSPVAHAQIATQAISRARNNPF